MSSHPWELAWKEGRWYEVSPALPLVTEFAHFLKENRVRAVLDFGSGAGRHSVYMGLEGISTVAFDISHSALSTLQDRVKKFRLENVFVSQNEMSHLPFVDNSFEAVIGTNVLHHGTTASINLAVSELFRILKPGAFGLMIVLSASDYKFGNGTMIEPNTYVLSDGDEKGIIHHFFTREEVEVTFREFSILSLEEEVIPIPKGNRGHFALRFEKRSLLSS